MSTFALISNWHGDGHSRLANITLECRSDYARRHGYLSISMNQPGHWGKVEALLSAWDKAEWLWWLDIDAAITNPSIPLGALVSDDGDIIVTCDINGLNSGSMLFRTAQPVRKFLEDLYSRRSEFNAPPYFEQAAFAHMLWRVKDIVRVIDQRRMNSYPDAYCRDIPEERWQPGDFVLHCPGLGFEGRETLLREALGMVGSK